MRLNTLTFQLSNIRELETVKCTHMPIANVCGLIPVIQTFLVLLLLHNNTSNLENKRQTAVIQLGQSLFCNIIPCPYSTCDVICLRHYFDYYHNAITLSQH